MYLIQIYFLGILLLIVMLVKLVAFQPKTQSLLFQYARFNSFSSTYKSKITRNLWNYFVYKNVLIRYTMSSQLSESVNNVNIKNSSIDNLNVNGNDLSVNNEINSYIITNQSILSGNEAINYMKSRVTYNICPTLCRNTFISWTRRTVNEKMKCDNLFSNFVSVRELRRKHSIALNASETNLMLAKEEYLSHQNYPVLSLLDKDISGGRQAINSMTKLVQNYLLYHEYMNAINSTLDYNQDSPQNNVFSVEVKNIFNGSVADIDQKDPALVNPAAAMMTANVAAGATTRKFTLEQINRIKNDLLPQKIKEINEKIQRRDILRIETAAYDKYSQSIKVLDDLYESIGLMSAIDSFQDQQKGVGSRRQNVGKGFEITAFLIVENTLIPYLAKLNDIQNLGEIFIVRNVKFGLASTKGATGEFDCIVCTKMPIPLRFVGQKTRGIFCKVLGVVEVKRNPDDIGDAFISYQRTLAWLAGYQETYNTDDWKTKAHPTGHFGHDKPYILQSDGECLAFVPESFSHFMRQKVELQPINDMESMKSISKPEELTNSSTDLLLESPRFSNIGGHVYDLFVNELYFVTKPAVVEGVSSKVSSWIMNKIATNELFDIELSDETNIENLRLSLLEKYPHRLSTIEVLDIYSKGNYTNQLFLIGKG